MTPAEMVGLRVAAIRDRRGMSQAQLGEELGRLLGKPWPRQTVSGAEKGQRAFTITELIALVYVLDTTLVALLAPPVELDRLDMPSGTQLSRQEVVFLGPMGAVSKAEAAATSYKDTSDVMGEVMQRASELVFSWQESDRKRAAEVSELYDRIITGLDSLRMSTDDEP